MASRIGEVSRGAHSNRRRFFEGSRPCFIRYCLHYLPFRVSVCRSSQLRLSSISRIRPRTSTTCPIRRHISTKCVMEITTTRSRTPRLTSMPFLTQPPTMTPCRMALEFTVTMEDIRRIAQAMARRIHRDTNASIPMGPRIWTLCPMAAIIMSCRTPVRTTTDTNYMRVAGAFEPRH